MVPLRHMHSAYTHSHSLVVWRWRRQRHHASFYCIHSPFFQTCKENSKSLKVSVYVGYLCWHANACHAVFFSATRKRKRDSEPIEKDSECMPFCVCVSSTSLLLFWIRKPNQISYDRIFMESINLLLALCLQKWTLKQTPTNVKFHTIPRPFAV